MFWKTIPRAVNLAALISTILLLVKLFIFNKIPEPVGGLHELGLVFEAVLASVLASYVFYLIVVHFKEVREKKTIYPFVTRWANLVVKDCKTQIAGFTGVIPPSSIFKLWRSTTSRPFFLNWRLMGKHLWFSGKEARRTGFNTLKTTGSDHCATLIR